MSKIAIIDQGTSSSKLFIFDVSSKTPKLIIKKVSETRLGSGIGENGYINREAIDGTIEVLNDFQKIIEEEGVEKQKAISTEVIRKATNREAVQKEILEKTGVSFQVLSQEDEAKIFWHGITNDFIWNKKIATIDIGGGSVEFMWGVKGKLEGYKLLKTGVVVLREKYLKTEPPTDKEYKKVEEDIKEAIKDLSINLGPETILIHGSNLVLDLFTEAKIPMSDFGYSESHPKKADLEDVRNFYLKTRNYKIEDKYKFFPSYPKFMDGVYAGFANILLIAEKVGIKYELPSNGSIIQGIILLIQSNEFDNFITKD